MTIDPFRTDDIAPFLKLAAAEGWVAEPWEFEFLLSEFSQGCFAARGDNGEAEGFVTSLLHDQSGWIGNLIVAEQSRGRGIGEALFRKAAGALWSAGTQTIWLTASKAGAPLYEKHGFTSIDTIIRWVGTGRQRPATHVATTDLDRLTDMSHGLDTLAWGDRRAALIGTTARRGRVLQNESGFIVQQPCANAVQLGPYSAIDSTSAEHLFDNAARTVALGTKVILDAPASNRSALLLFNHKKMRIAGSNVLMYAGIKPDYRPELLYGLASMGSCG
jgi:ribosomal protein S18 acetylase RimI-like enzyme